MLAREVRCELPDDAGVRAEERRGVKQGRGRGLLRWRAGKLKHERDPTIRTAPTTEVGETTGRGKREETCTRGAAERQGAKGERLLCLKI